jgi:putative ABC transport system permease protein
MSYVPLSWPDLALAALLVLGNGLVSIAFRLDLEKALAVAALRTLLQLGLIGFVLRLLFSQTSPLWTALIVTVMGLVAGHEVWARQSSRLAGWSTFALGSATLLLVGLLTSFYVIAVVVGLEPWYRPHILVPILGMVLGNSLTSVALALESLTEAAATEKAAIEARLALGATRYEAFETSLKRSLRLAIMPMINSMAVAGIVSLPGMMTGQILSGVDPVEAAKYQIMIMFALAGSTGLAAVLAGFGGVHLLTDDRHRLRLDRVTRRL